jgi:DNA-binding MarR family transcriptional regulator
MGKRASISAAAPAPSLSPVPGFTGEGVAGCLCRGVRVAARRLTALYERALEKEGLSIAQFALIAQLATRGQASMSALAQAVEIDASTLSRTLRPLELAGLIVVEADPRNRRVRMVHLSSLGRAKAKSAGRAWASAQRAAAAAIPRNLVADLLRATENLD